MQRSEQVAARGMGEISQRPGAVAETLTQNGVRVGAGSNGLLRVGARLTPSALLPPPPAPRR